MEVLRQASFKIRALPKGLREKFEPKDAPGVTKLPKGFDSEYIATEKSERKYEESVKIKAVESEEIASAAAGRTVFRVLEVEDCPNRDPSPCKEKLLELFDSFKFASLEVKDKVEAKCVRFFKNEDAVQIEAEFSSDSERTIDEIIEEDYSMIEVHDFVILVGGAKEESGRATEHSSTVEVYDCHTQEWTALPPLPVEVTACSACQVPGIPALVVVGGYGRWRALNTIQLFDWVKREWQLLHPMRKRRWGSVSVPTDHGVIVVGGCDQGSVLRSMELYSFKRKEWFTLPPMQQARCNFGGAIIGKKLFLAGGGTGFYFNSAIDTVEYFDGETGKWSYIAAMRHKRYGCTAIEWQGKFVVIGGCDEHGVDISAVEVYDTTVSEWTELAPLPVGLSLCRAISVQNKLVVLGADGWNNEAYAYDFDLHRWETFIELPLGRNAFSVVVLGI